MKMDKQLLDIQWLDFPHFKNQINQFRHAVYVQEQGLHHDNIEATGDESGLHLAAFYEGELISIISGFFIGDNSTDHSHFEQDRAKGLVLRFGMRMEKKSIRGSGLSELLCIHMGLSCFETIRPSCTFVHLFEAHRGLAKSYVDWGFRPDSNIDDDGILICRGPEEQLAQYRINRQKLELVKGLFPEVTLPSMLSFLHETARDDVVCIEHLKQENLYASGLQLSEDLPRLKAQARLLFDTQSAFFDEVDDIHLSGKLLDVGSGTGDYLSLLQAHQRFVNYEIEGLDNSELLNQYAKINYPNIQRHQAGVYESGLASNDYHFIHAGFVFIHLTHPQLALKEIHRLLATNGLLYIVDVNDSTFSGPSQISDVVHRHLQLYEGNRNIMNVLPNLAEQSGFVAHYNAVNRVFSRGSKEQPAPLDADVTLDNDTFISLFDFIGLREELAADYEAAKKDCLSTEALMGIEIQTQVYRRL